MKKKTWKEFSSSGMLWWVNRIIHTFGWAIVLEVDENNEIVNCYPARVTYLGFTQKSDEVNLNKFKAHIKKSTKSK